MDGREHFLVVGASLAGLRGVEALRAAGYAGRITIVGAEAHLPYNRPPLSKKILTGEQEVEEVAFPIAEDLDVEWRLGSPAAGLDVAARRVTLANGEGLDYDRLLIATGVTPIMPDIPGRDLAGVHTLRDLDHAMALRREMAPGKSLVILGSGFIGCEVAASARKLGLEVTIVDRLGWPMNRVMGPEIAGLFREIHEEQGVQFRMEAQAAAFLGEGRVTGVQLAGGEVLQADIVLVGVGSAPATGWLEGSGLVLQNGILCDHACLAENGSGRIAAAGDVAVWPHHGFGSEVMRMEHWTNAFEQGAAAALALVASAPEPYLPLPSFWSDQYSYKIQALGRPQPTDVANIVAGSLESRKFVLEYSDGTGVTGVISVNMPARIAGYRRDLGAEIQRRAARD
ncbi:Reductase C-terminal [Paracoccus aminovorans]|uniref:Reductase C-terminal n=1 Tax=Paracoccus aminovorans TaxID=34004 RepID=A0A1I3B3E8_9RHOB|nr:FAD-dependent oxidoreductase [Paracoccus aminovorans]CQR87574.1 NAD(P)H-nitrite reductase [Paracoccus aminovorans]SFH56720.1 Reductase C-terminal [Paracoccus aminovorans]